MKDWRKPRCHSYGHHGWSTYPLLNEALSNPRFWGGMFGGRLTSQFLSGDFFPCPFFVVSDVTKTAGQARDSWVKIISASLWGGAMNQQRWRNEHEQDYGCVFMHITWPLHDISTWLTRIFKLPMQAFDVRELHRSPPFFSDQGGTFEVVEDASFAGLRPIRVEESRRIWWW